MRVITSHTNPVVKTLRSLHTGKGRRAHNLFLAEGVRIIRDALECGHAPRHLVVLKSRADTLEDDPALAAIIAAAAEAGAEILAVSTAVLGKISRKDNPQMLVASFAPHITHGMPDFAAAIKPPSSMQSPPPCFIALDRIRDPGNLGTIMRTLDAVAGAGIILIGACCDATSPEAVRASMGAVFTSPIACVTEAEFIKGLAARREGGGHAPHVIATVPDSTADYRKAGWHYAPLMLLLGNEQEGLSSALVAAADEAVRLPMHGRADSLNLAVAAGICLYEYRARHATGEG